MRYHFEKPKIYIPLYGQTYMCDHPVYSRCTLFKINNKGLSVIQQRHDSQTKTTWWDEIDGYLVNPLYLNPRFKPFFDLRADQPTNGVYPTVTVRQIMWALKMKPLKRERWETCFDRREV